MFQKCENGIMFRRQDPMRVENNVAALEVNVDRYRLTVTIQRHDAAAIAEDEGERALTTAGPLILAFQTARFGG